MSQSLSFSQLLRFYVVLFAYELTVVPSFFPHSFPICLHDAMSQQPKPQHFDAGLMIVRTEDTIETFRRLCPMMSHQPLVAVLRPTDVVFPNPASF